MDLTNELPKFIAYNLDPTYFDLVGTAITNFQANDKGIKSKVQMGSGWWFQRHQVRHAETIEILILKQVC